MMRRSFAAAPQSQKRLRGLDLRAGYFTLVNNPASYTVTSGGAADTTGAWVEIFPSTEADFYSVEISLINPTSQTIINTSSLLEIGIGASGSETTIVPYLQVGHTHRGISWDIPVFIPKGTRLSARVTCSVASRSVTFTLRPKSSRGGWKPAPYCASYGVVLSSSRGTVVTIPGAINSKGAWVELTAATTERLCGLIVGTGSGSNNMTAQTIILDIGMGPSGSETVVIPDVFSEYSVSEEIWVYGSPRLFAVDIAAGTRLAARMAKSNLATNHNCNLVGIPWR